VRRLLILMLVVILGGSLLAGSSNAKPGVFTEMGAGQDAEGDWIVLTGHSRGVYYYVDAFRSLTRHGVIAKAYVGKGPCTVTREKLLVTIVCKANTRAHPVSMNQFRMDPALASASLRLKDRGFVQRVSWRAKGAPIFGGDVPVNAAPGDVYTGANAAWYQWAPARAKLFGKSLPFTPLSFASLSVGGEAFAYVEGGATYSFDRAGRLHVTRTIRLRR
jgi:hypothetical protein